MKITALTSFGPEGFVKYGRRFLDTFRRFWPASVELLVYHENQPDLGGFDLLRDVAPCAEFLARHRGDVVVAGRKPQPGKPWKSSCLAEGYNFRFDAYKFCRKVFAVEHAAAHAREGLLFWVDADVVTFDHVTEEFLARQLPSWAALSYLGRQPGYHSECGFVGYNLDHPCTEEFVRAFARLYQTDGVFALDEWHDSWVFDWLRRELTPPAHNLSPGGRGHVFVQSELGSCMDHLKGDRKSAGRSYVVPNDKVPHDHPYWRQR